MRTEQMIEKMIETFKRNFDEETYGKGYADVTPQMIKLIFEQSDFFKLFNIKYRDLIFIHQKSNMLYCGQYGYMDGSDKHNFNIKNINGLNVGTEFIFHVSNEIVLSLEKYFLNMMLKNFICTNNIYSNNVNIKVTSERMYNEDKNLNVLTPSCFLNKLDLRLLEEKHSIGNIVHLRDNIFVERYPSEGVINYGYIVFNNILADYSPNGDILIYRFLKNNRYEIYFNANFDNFNRDVKIVMEEKR